jgi:hypothetical protein
VPARRTEQSAERRSAARKEAANLSDDPFCVASITAYRAEGTKNSRRVAFADPDPQMISLSIAWAMRYLDLTCERFTIALHLHTGQDEDECQRFWSERTGLPLESFRKTFFKVEGTGHRKNSLYNGTAQIRITKSSALLDKLLGWIEGLAAALAESSYHSAGR